jgi:lipid II:glycine glycyltransferase (peptidoglycan interpeptide bridge formation enzyme)
MPEINVSEWDAYVSEFPDAHILQTSLWGEFKSYYGWESAYVIKEFGSEKTIGAQILFRRLPLGYRIAYLPKGPLSKDDSFVRFSEWDEFWPEVDILCEKRKAIFLKVETDVWEPPRNLTGSETTTQPVAKMLIPIGDDYEYKSHTAPTGFQVGSSCIQPQRTLLVSLHGDEERIMGRMKQKTRYNIRLAIKKSVIVRPSPQIELFYDLIKITGNRDSFSVHSLDYYRRAYELFHPRGMCELFIAFFEDEPLAGLMVFANGKRAWYFYGASSDKHRELMPSYLLQWEAMRWARSMGCTEYDLWGVPDVSADKLESDFTSRSDGLWGVYRFKRGFGGRLYRAVDSLDRIYNPRMYSLYTLWTNRGRVREAG